MNSIAATACVDPTWTERELEASYLVAQLLELYARQRVELTTSGRSLIGLAPVRLIELLDQAQPSHSLAERVAIGDVLHLARGLATEQLHPSQIDIGHLATQWVQLGRPIDLHRFYMITLGRRFLSPFPRKLPPIEIVLIGFGRVARVLTRSLARFGSSASLRIRAVVLRSAEEGQLQRRAFLFENDSVYGGFVGSVTIDEFSNRLFINGSSIDFLEQSQLGEMLRCAECQTIVVDTSGQMNATLLADLRANHSLGQTALLATYPLEDAPTIIHGANQWQIHEHDDRIYSTGSDMANAVVPILQLLHDEYCITDCHIDLVRPYTNDQNLLDNIHTTPRLGRAAPTNLVLTDYDLGAEVSRILPSLKGLISCSSIRAPVANGALVILTFRATEPLDRESLNFFLRQQSERGDLREQIEYLEVEDFVSSDIKGNPHSAVIDAVRTLTGPSHATLYIWYDNEYGFAVQLIRLLQEFSRVSVMQYS